MALMSRDQAVEVLTRGHAVLDAYFAHLSDEEMVRPATVGGGAWSAKDLLGHLAYWEEQAVRAVAEWQAGRRPTVEDIAATGQAGLDAANAAAQVQIGAQSLTDVRARAAAAQAAVVDAIRSLSEDAWRAAASYPNPSWASLGELLAAMLGEPGHPFGHAFAHRPELAAYVESLGRRPHDTPASTAP